MKSSGSGASVCPTISATIPEHITMPTILVSPTVQIVNMRDLASSRTRIHVGGGKTVVIVSSNHWDYEKTELMRVDLGINYVLDYMICNRGTKSNQKAKHFNGI